MTRSFITKWAGVWLAFLFFTAGLSAQSEEVISLREGWKFSPCDKLEFAKPDFDDANWIEFKVDRTWEEQGFQRLDGYGWYRIHVSIPSLLKQKAYLKDGLRIFLGKINNFDQAFLNGRIFGINGKTVAENIPAEETFIRAEKELWNQERCYVLPPDDPRILWDGENVIAVRVFDEGGSGGMYTGNQSIRMMTLTDSLTLDIKSRPFSFLDQQVKKTIVLKNNSTVRTLQGTMTISAENKLSKATLLSKIQKITLKPLADHELTVVIPGQDQSGLITYQFQFIPTGEKTVRREEIPYILTPKPPQAPRINGPKAYGARPNHPFLFSVPATGLRPMTFSAQNLPPGLAIDPDTGIISGRPTVSGELEVILTAANRKGKDRKEIKLFIGNRICLTPPLGWNSWNCWGLSVDQNKVLASARVFKEKGLADHGWSYINIDDGWEIVGNSPKPKRDARGTILTNEKFPDMKSLAQGIHAIGLKMGIYSSPGPLTCGGYTASYQHEKQDAQTFADWGVDYLKYDWCSYEKIAKDDSLPELKIPYQIMRQALNEVDRDIVYSLCQYGMGKVWEWGAEVGGNLWRTTGDITDTWQSVKEIGFSQVDNAPFTGPGLWNDPDMLVVGWVGWGPSLHPTDLTPDEQYTHISLWCLLSAPLLIGCDLERLDEFSLNLLTNDEVLAVDQDPLGRQAVPVIRQRDIQVWVKELADGGKAVGVFNLGEETANTDLDLAKIGFSGKTAIRDLWRQKNISEFSGKFPIHVPAHGVKLIKVIAK